MSGSPFRSPDSHPQRPSFSASGQYEDRLEFFCDDTRYFVFRRESADPAVWPFAHPHYLILNLAIGGSWGGQKGIDESLFPHRFEIDYVRYYEKLAPMHSPVAASM
jgi:hypothetical protein